MLMTVFYLVSFIIVSASLIVIYKVIKKVRKTTINKEKIKKQLDFTTKYLENTAFELPVPALVNGYKTLYMMEVIINMVAKWVVSNEIGTDEHNIFNKQLQVYNFVLSMTHSPEYKNNEFKDFCYNHIKELFEELDKI